jgi:hypothetical protein
VLAGGQNRVRDEDRRSDLRRRVLQIRIDSKTSNTWC